MVTVNIELRSTQRLFGLTSKLSTSAIVNNNVTIIIADRRNWFKLRLLEEILVFSICVVECFKCQICEFKIVYKVF